MSTEPAFVGDLRQAISRVDMCALGWAEGWAAPVSVIDAPGGFGEELWDLPQSATLIAWRLSGAEAISELPNFVGRSTGLGQTTFNLQVCGMPQRYRAEGGIKFCQFFITDSILRRVVDGIDCREIVSGNLRHDLIMAEDRALCELLDLYARRACDRSAPPTRIELEARALLIVEYLITNYHVKGRQAPAAGGLAPWQLRRACEAMEARLDATLGLDDLAEIAGCSPTHFSRAFKQSMGRPPFHWLNEQRIGKAKILLEQSELSLAEIALAVGFAAQPQFTTAFGRATGMTPGAWRRARKV